VQAQVFDSDTHSIVVDARTEVIAKSMTQSEVRNTCTITVLNAKGLSAAQFVCGCDKFNSLQKFSGEIMNASGQTVRKVKKSDLQKTEYSPYALATDDYYYYYDGRLPAYPFTVKYEWETECRDGLLTYPTFMPQAEYNQLVMNASYRIELPAGQACRYRRQHTEENIVMKESTGDKGQHIIEATATQLQPLVTEPFGPSSREIMPRVYFAPADFAYDKTEGNSATWQSFGEWQSRLLEGRDELTEPFKAKLHELTAHCTTDREKVEAVYNYLAATTRYVSIQLGIGGLQPIPAAEVCHTGFGDCKGLSNYARAMLKELGIPSTYVVISTVNERLLSDFASANQMNHVILQVPLPGDTLWLECTNANLPFGYVHQDIAGHDALLIEPDGGRIHRLPTYPDSLHTQNIKAHIVLSPAAEAAIEVNEESRLFQYEDELSITYMEPSKQKDRIRSGINLAQADILSVKVDERKATHPSLTVNYTAGSNQYGRKTGNRLFVPVNVFRKVSNLPEVTKRTQPVHVNYGYVDTDSIRIQIPEGYVIEGSLKPMYKQDSPFGTFASTIHVDGQELLIVQRLYLHKGIYRPEAYAAFREFRNAVAKQYNAQVVLVKK
jgi:transglutaminase-like putative cysteine protease